MSTGGLLYPGDAAAQAAIARAGDITISGAGLTVGLWRTSDPIDVAGGYGGFNPASRPKDVGLTVWDGRDPFTMTMPLLLHDGGTSVEPDRRALNTLASGTRYNPPPQVTVDGDALPIPAAASGLWVISDLSWGDEVRRRRDGSLTRKLVTITLLEFVEDDLLRQSTAKTRRDGKQIVRHYRVKHGDTLESIAARHLGDAKRWTDLAAINGLRSSGQLKAHQLLTLP